VSGRALNLVSSQRSTRIVLPTPRANRPDREDEDLVRLYLNDIGRHALLTKDDEARLGAVIEAGARG